MNQLTIRVAPDDDHVWQIHLDLLTDTFSGRGWFWASPETLEKFTAALTEYPLLDAPSLVLGYDQMQGDDLMLFLSIGPLGNLGVLEARVEMADRDDPACRLKAKLLTSYANLDRFVPQLRALTAGARDEAILLGG